MNTYVSTYLPVVVPMVVPVYKHNSAHFSLTKRNLGRQASYVVISPEDLRDVDLAHSVAFAVEVELDYLLLVNEDFDFFGYGSTLPEALNMLADNMRMVRDDFFSGTVNESNTDHKKLERIRELFLP